MNEANTCRRREAAASEGSVSTGVGARILAGLRRHERWLWGLVLVGLVADAALTVYGLQQGMAEANPVVRASMAVFGVVGGILVVKAVALGLAATIRALVEQRLAGLVPTVIGVLWLVGGMVNLANLLAV